jgi:hypothetical protein
MIGTVNTAVNYFIVLNYLSSITKTLINRYQSGLTMTVPEIKTRVILLAISLLLFVISYTVMDEVKGTTLLGRFTRRLAMTVLWIGGLVCFQAALWVGNV